LKSVHFSFDQRYTIGMALGTTALPLTRSNAHAAMTTIVAFVLRAQLSGSD